MQANKLIFQNTNFSSWKMLPQLEQWIGIHSDLECSHLCWNRKCVNMDHVIIEEHKANLDRIECALQGLCNGHEIYNCFK